MIPNSIRRQLDALPYLTAAVLGILVGALIALTTLAAAGGSRLSPADAALLAVLSLVVGIILAGQHGLFGDLVPDR